MHRRHRRRLDDITEAMRDVVDPELGINVVDLGLVYGITVDQDDIAVIDMTLTSAACPLTDVIEDQTGRALATLVTDFRINWVWMPPVGTGQDHRRGPRAAAGPRLQRLSRGGVGPARSTTRRSLAVGYSGQRRADPRIAAQVHAALGGRRPVLDVGAGAGSYEPAGRRAVVAVEPSLAMLAQRPAGGGAGRPRSGRAAALRDRRPSRPRMASLHRAPLDRPRRRAGRAARGSPPARQVVLTWDPEVVARSFWFTRDYLPEALERELGPQAWQPSTTSRPPCRRSGSRWCRSRGTASTASTARTGAGRRRTCCRSSATRSRRSPCSTSDLVDDAVRRLAADLATGRWAARYADLLEPGLRSTWATGWWSAARAAA